MNCEEMQTLLGPYIDGELPELRTQAAESHLQGCTTCRADHQRLARVSGLIRQEGRFTPPPQLQARIQERLRQLDDETPVRAGFPPWLSFAAPSLVFGFALAWGLALMLGPVGNHAAVDQLIAAHVRSLMVDHLTDVSSSDHHTVKPWFNGKLDFAPPVEDFTRDGFPLIGGRLDYLDDRPVAALVYRHRQHLINLFIRPSPQDSGTRVTAIRQRGYHLLSWNRAGLAYRAISDLNPEDMHKFAALFNAVDAPAPIPGAQPGSAN